MTYAALAQPDFPSFSRHVPSPDHLRPAIACAVVVALSGALAHWMASARLPADTVSGAASARVDNPEEAREHAATLTGHAPPPLRIPRPDAAPRRSEALRVRAVPPPAPHAQAHVYDAWFAPAISLGSRPAGFAHNAPLASNFTPPVPQASASAAPTAAAERTTVEHETVAARTAPARVAQTQAVQPRIVPPLPAAVSELTPDVPIPPRRPAELALPRPVDPSPPRQRLTRLPSRSRLARQTASAAPASAPADRRNFFEKLFGMPQPAAAAASGPAVAYATPEVGSSGLSGNSALGEGSAFGGGLGLRGTLGAAGGRDGRTAVYEIATHTVYLPDGRRLEAHSGLGAALDDPGGVHQRMRGATPPNLYELRPREALFHGVRALRLNPVGGTTYGRNGLLAHTYMLGPRGDSNGCVSFRDYNAFLQAYESGAVRRLAVVARLN